MAHFWKDLYEVERNCIKESWRFIKKHPIGYGSLVVVSASLCVAPMMIDAVNDKVTETKIKKSKKANLEERVTKLEYIVWGIELDNKILRDLKLK